MYGVLSDVLVLLISSLHCVIDCWRVAVWGFVKRSYDIRAEYPWTFP